MQNALLLTPERLDLRERRGRVRGDRCDQGSYFRNSARKVGSPGGHFSAVLM